MLLKPPQPNPADLSELSQRRSKTFSVDDSFVENCPIGAQNHGNSHPVIAGKLVIAFDICFHHRPPGTADFPGNHWASIVTEMTPGAGQENDHKMAQEATLCGRYTRFMQEGGQSVSLTSWAFLSKV